VGKKWGSATLMDFAASLSKKPTSANAGDLVGNRMLYSNDYMVSEIRYMSLQKNK
jgi:hypothetical protein